MCTPLIHHARTTALCLLGLTFGLQGCGPKAAPPPAAAAPTTPPAGAQPEANPASVPSPATPAQATAAKTATPPVAQPTVQPVPEAGAPLGKASPPTLPAPIAPSAAPEAKPAATATAPVQASSPVSDPGGEVAVKPTKAGLFRAGMTSCKMCHKVQFTSWSDTAHAKRNPPLDCESCHGPGSEYKAMATMKDPAKAAAAGLVRPGASFCTTCHKRNWSDGMLKQAHAHKT